MDSRDLQFVDNVLRDRRPAFGPTATRRGLLQGLAAAGAAAAALGLAGGGGVALAAAAPAGGADTTQSILNIADTAEHLAVTYLGYVLAKANPPQSVAAILAAARYEEQVHLQVLESVGARPLTTTFSLGAGSQPDLGLVTDLSRALATIEVAEGVFVAAYLAAVADFAAAGNWKWAQYCAEILGVEAEHRTLARLAQGETPANNLAFEAASLPSVGAAATTLTQLGFLSPQGANSFSYPGPGDVGAGSVGVTGLTLANSTPGGAAAAAAPATPQAMPDTGMGGMARRRARTEWLGAAAGGAAAVLGLGALVRPSGEGR
jgi:hypothetical protein